MTVREIIDRFNAGEITREDARQLLVATGMDYVTAKHLTNGSMQPRQPPPPIELKTPTTKREYWRQYAECRRKRRFKISSHARAYRDKLAAETGEDMKVYECHWCGCLHVAHANTKAKAA